MMFFAPPVSTPATYYVASAGSDSNDGLSPSTPWATLAKVNATDGAMPPGTTVRFNRGDLWHEQLSCLNQVNATDATSLESSPPACSGITFGAYGSGLSPIFDGADTLHLVWVQVGAGTWKAPLQQVPSKLFVDHPTSETAMLLPMPNPVGDWSAATAYRFLDMVIYNGGRFIYFNTNGGAGGGIYAPALFIGVDNPVAGNQTQSFSSINTGLQNVQATPGSWYYSGSTIYVHLPDESDPNTHLFEGTYRKYGVLLSSVNHVTVEDIAVERTQKSAFAAVSYSDSTLAGGYFTNEYNTFTRLQAWNYGDIGARDCLPNQTYGCLGNSEAGILSHAFLASQRSTELIRGTVITNNQLGRFDTYMGLLGGVSDAAGIQAQGQDNASISNNVIATLTAPCLIYHINDVGTSDNNRGGDVGYNTCGDNQGNIFFGATTAGRLHHNIVTNSFGEGIQLGGNDSKVVVDHNLVFNLGLSASGSLYNGLDCNGGAANSSITNNTIVNTYASAITLEYGCNNATVENNVFSQHAITWPAANGLNHSYLFYFIPGVQSGSVFNHNLWFPGSNEIPFNSLFDCSNFFTSWPDASSSCGDPQFIDSANGDFRLRDSSPGHGSGIAATGALAGGDLGAGLSAAISKVTPIVTWPMPAATVYGEPLGNAELNATASVPGTLTYTPPLGTILGAGTHSLSVSLAPEDANTYSSVLGSTLLTVNQADLSLHINDAFGVYGEGAPTLTGVMTGVVNRDSVTFSLSAPSGSLLVPGRYPIQAAVTGDNLASYALTTTAGTLTITRAPTSVSIALSPVRSGKVQVLNTVVSVTTTGLGQPSGDVMLYSGNLLVGQATLRGGGAVFQVKNTTSAPPQHLRATYLGDSDFLGSSVIFN